MTTFLRGWLTPGSSVVETSGTSPTSDTPSPTISPPSDDEDGSITETEQHDDSPPAFPSLLSAQRIQAPASAIITDAQRMPPPPLLRSLQRNPAAISSLAVPLTTTKRPPKKREKVVLAPGHSTLDWAILKASGQDLRVRALGHNTQISHLYLAGS
jgi:hypothetical protein